MFADKLKIAFVVLLLFLFLSIVLFFIPRCLNKELRSKMLEAQNKYHQEVKNENYAIVIDYSLPVYARRLWVLNLSNDEVVLNSHVSHAWNSGVLFADSFSNVSGSEYSCIGVFVTQNEYESSFGKGEYKLGMRINGLEAKNDKSLERNIVFHCSYSPWSSGCFMTFPKTNKRIVDLTKEGSLVFVNR